MTDADGRYTLAGLSPGTDYRVCFDPYFRTTGGSAEALGYLPECYENESSWDTSTPVTVALGGNRANTNAALAAAGAISGTVTDAGGVHDGLESVLVRVHSVTTGTYGLAYTEADGTYAVEGLLAGSDYEVCFDTAQARGGSSDGYAGQCLDSVSVTLGQAEPGVDAALVGMP